jgi:UDP-N-acetylglucosamine--N-acetylmuramyl-(pentapeptide) pyrophosphoryl-undecaprenol N-acetylglucosamine transferase
MNKRIIFTGGGTAGHVVVNLALIPQYLNDGWKVDYIGSIDGIERNLIEPLENVTYHPISTGKLRRYISKENLKDPFKVLKGTMQAKKIIKRLKPAVIFSKGGFVSVPVVLAAKLQRVPAVIHESDYTPGLANKIAIPFAKKVLATFSETMDYLPDKKREYVGAVIREELFQGKKNKGLNFAGLTGSKPILLIMGGSAGSQKLNNIIRDNLQELLNSFQIIHICGKDNVDPSADAADYTQFEYVNEELKDLFAVTDFVVSRAGSNAIFEFLALRIPMLLIPLSLKASRGDQIVNAQSFKEKQYAHVLQEEELTAATLLSELQQLQTRAPVIIDKMKEYKSEKARERVMEIIREVQKK